MNRATVVYIIMLIASVVGLWAILAAGEKLVPPPDFAGQWQLTDNPLPGARATQKTIGPGMFIEQSGHFFQIAIDNAPQLSLRLNEQVNIPAAGQKRVRISLTGEPWRMVFEGPPGGDVMHVRIIGPRPEQSGEWIARRVIQTFSGSPPKNASEGGH